MSKLDIGLIDYIYVGAIGPLLRQGCVTDHSAATSAWCFRQSPSTSTSRDQRTQAELSMTRQKFMG